MERTPLVQGARWLGGHVDGSLVMQDANLRRQEALSFLEELAARHDQVLEELDRLNARVEAVIAQYQRSRSEVGVSEDPSVEV
ncbi:MAG: hypothetical protein KatS3mg111_2878 [Pirellulaceae bacterium]|nr:MAG: hypothetical protein KatS3mg111_2878 [Pirellulaceae bacterium]